MNRAGVKILAGLSPMNALQAATLNAAKCAGQLDELGSIEGGKIADLILLEADPLSSIANTMKIDSVFFDGKYFDRAKLAKIRNDLKSLAAEM